MSFRWEIKGRGGEDILKKYSINTQGLGLAPNCAQDTAAPHTLNDIRIVFQDHPYKEKLPEAAIEAVQMVKGMLAHNLDSLVECHCNTCKCPTRESNWDIEQIKRFLSIPLEDVDFAEGGF